MMLLSVNSLWKCYSKLIRAIRKNTLTYWLARRVPQLWRSRLLGAVERQLREQFPVVPDKLYRVLGHQMYLDPRTEHGLGYITGTFEQDVTKIFEMYIRPNTIVLDVGANVGFYTLLAASLVGEGGRVYAFEPQPDVRALLVRSVAVNGYKARCQIVPLGVSNKAGTATFYLGSRDSIYASLFANQNTEGTVIIETVTLDKFFAMEGWPSVDLIKMDIEGAEKYALEGMIELSRRNPQLKLILEYGVHTAHQAGYAQIELAKVLSELNFSKGFWIEGGMREFMVEGAWPDTGYGNFLFTKEGIDDA